MNEDDKKQYIKQKIKEYYKNKKVQQIKKYNELRKKDVIYRIIDNLSRRLMGEIQKYGITKNFTHLEMIGCSLEKLKQHLEKQFDLGMSYDNYGEWEIDHI